MEGWVPELRDALAERLLARVMEWGPSDVARERPDLQALAAYRYDEYQQFSPGKRFIESLALWLEQFESKEERGIAYKFVRNRLVFVSTSEMSHLVGISYPDVISPFLVNQVATRRTFPEWRVKSIFRSQDFVILLRQSMFLGLSDGAAVDVFRRSNPDISHEQVSRTHEISKDRAAKMREELTRDLQKILERSPSDDEARFRMVFLLDDFSGSGLSYIRTEKDGYKGKLVNFHAALSDSGGDLQALVKISELRVCLVLYMATMQACEHLEKVGAQLFGKIPFAVRVVYRLPISVRLDSQKDQAFLELLPKYYDAAIEDEHYLKGRHDRPYLGFDECGLPLVLSHNTPNNSVPILWFQENRRFRGLFPRVSRFGETG
jgi:hypothetical protein